MSFLKAFVYKNAQQIKSVPELIRDFESRPIICDMIGFPFGKIPDESNFYRFVHEHKNSEIQELLYSSNKILLKVGVTSTDIVIADSKPVKADTKENNLKNPNRSLDKTELGYYSCLDDAYSSSCNLLSEVIHHINVDTNLKSKSVHAEG